uniref:Heterogeneous nuclear ribonucleoprotein A1 n=1 Tax=Ascaris suum TaxID=6253 RepID=F1KXM1_ASCSU
MVQAEESGDVSAGALEAEQFRKMFIGGLTSTTTDETLKEFYSTWGELVDCVVMRDPTTKRSRGFGFVTYSKQSEVNAAMENRPHVIDGKTVDPKRAVPRDQSQRNEANVSSKRLYISGVREGHTEEMFTDYFSNYGNVIKCEVIVDKNTGKPRGFAFVTFDDYDAVDKCVLIKNHMINNARCDVKKALSKEEMNRAQQHDRERMDRGARSRGPVGGSGGGGGGGWSAPGGDRGGYGSQSWASAGPGGYGGGQSGGYSSSSGGSRAPYYGGANYGGAYSGGYDTSYQVGARGGGWGGESGGGWSNSQSQGGWGAQETGTGGGWGHGGQPSQSWGNFAGQGRGDGRGY